MKKKKISSTFLTKFLGHLTKKGKKTKAFSFMLNAMSLFGHDRYVVLENVFNKIKPYVEVRSVRVRRFTNIVPFPVPVSRQFHLASLWLLTSISRDNRKVSFSVKLKDEIKNIIDSKGETYKKKFSVYSLALKNRSNSHYRWY